MRFDCETDAKICEMMRAVYLEFSQLFSDLYQTCLDVIFNRRSCEMHRSCVSPTPIAMAGPPKVRMTGKTKATSSSPKSSVSTASSSKGSKAQREAKLDAEVNKSLEQKMKQAKNGDVTKGSVNVKKAKVVDPKVDPKAVKKTVLKAKDNVDRDPKVAKPGPKVPKADPTVAKPDPKVLKEKPVVPKADAKVVKQSQVTAKQPDAQKNVKEPVASKGKGKTEEPKKVEKAVTYVPVRKRCIEPIFNTPQKKGKALHRLKSSDSLSSGGNEKVKALLNTVEEQEEGAKEEAEDDEGEEKEEEEEEEEAECDEVCEDDAEGEEEEEGEDDEAFEIDGEPLGEEDQEDEQEEEEEEQKGNEAEAETAQPKKCTVPLRNSVTNKKDWDNFVRSKGRFKVHEYFQSNKLECFNMWLDCDKSWDETALQVERIQKNEVKSKRGWVAVQGTKLVEQRGKEKAEKIIKSRRESGMYYNDEDFPDDEMEPLPSRVRRPKS